MTDLEMVKACAAAMGYQSAFVEDDIPYDPLHNDEQAMALIKKLHLRIWETHQGTWYCQSYRHGDGRNSNEFSSSKLLNRAIVEYVAKMQAATALPQ